MARYIDADALKEVLTKLADDPWNANTGTTWSKAYDYCIEYLDEQPTADVVEVVRCKECKYRDDDDFCTGRGYPNALVPDDGFCDKGERRE